MTRIQGNNFVDFLVNDNANFAKRETDGIDVDVSYAFSAGEYQRMLRVYDEPADSIGIDLGPLDRAWVHVSLAAAHARIGNQEGSEVHARVAADSRLAHGGREPRVEVLTARLAALRGQDSRMFAALENALNAGWMDAALLDRDPVFRPFRSRPEFAALRDILEERMRAARQALAASGPPEMKVASASAARRAGPGGGATGHR